MNAGAEIGVRFNGNHAVARNLVTRHPLDREHRTIETLKHVNHLLDRRRLRIDHIVAEEHRERLVADQFARHQHRVAEAERLALAHVGKIDHVRDLADLGELIALAARLEKCLQFDRDVEMILDRVLAPTGDQDNGIGARRDRLLHAILDDRFVDQREHLLRLRLRGGKESRPESGGTSCVMSFARSAGTICAPEHRESAQRPGAPASLYGRSRTAKTKC